MVVSTYHTWPLEAGMLEAVSSFENPVGILSFMTLDLFSFPSLPAGQWPNHGLMFWLILN